jgi:hypothetical protein
MTQVLDVSTATPTHEAAMKLAESAISAGLAVLGQDVGDSQAVTRGVGC